MNFTRADANGSEPRGGLLKTTAAALSIGLVLLSPITARADFVRGDCNGDGVLRGSTEDAIYLLSFLFLGSTAPPCRDACDANDDGTANLSDAVYTLSFLFTGGPPPRPPFPVCGVDPTADDLPACPLVDNCPRPPVAIFTFSPLVGSAPARVIFDGRESSDPDGTITAYEWDFGDGETDSRSRVPHTYAEAATYTVSLTVTDDSGLSVTASQEFVVTELTHDVRFNALVSSIRQEMRELEAPGVAVAVLEDGEVTFAAGFGSKHPHRSDPVEPTTLFRIASVTKMMTAAGLLQLVESGQVDLDAPITTYLPEFSFSFDETWAPSITPRHLLTHTPAMADYLELDVPELKDDSALAEFMNGAYGEHPAAYSMAPAGRMYNYTNVGFVLAGLVTEAVSGVFYREYLKDNVFTPLGMHRTHFLPDKVLADGDFATGDLGEFGRQIGWDQIAPDLIEPDSYDNVWGRPAGYAFSSALDLAEFVKFIRVGNPDVLADDLRMAMREPQMDMEVFLDFLHYGFGLIVQEAGFYRLNSSDFHRMRIVTHGGDLPGFAADLYYVPDVDLGFVCLANASGAHLSESFITALNTLGGLPAPSPVPNLGMNPAVDYPIYAGDYLDSFNVGPVRVAHVGNELRVSMPVLDDLSIGYDPVLLPSSRNNFLLLLTGVPLQVTFILDAEGQAEYFRTRSFVAAREGAQRALRRTAPEPLARPLVPFLPAPVLTPFTRPLTRD